MRKAEISNQTLGILLVAAIALSLIGTFVTVTKIGTKQTIKLVGYAPATDTGTALVNLTVDEILDINFTTASLDWGIGNVAPGEINCTLSTQDPNSASCISFNSVSDALKIENIGNMNVTINISFNGAASDFIGGTSPGYEFNWTCREGNSCQNTTGNGACGTNTNDVNMASWGGEVTAGAWNIVNKSTTNDYVICPLLRVGESNDDLKINMMAIVPSDSFTGNLSSTITATAYLIDSQQ